MKYLVIGLGIYGRNLALDLTGMGHEVIGVDQNAQVVEALKDYISAVYTLDTTDEHQLDVLPLGNIDLVIVAIGENFGASVKTVALLKQRGVKHIYARAIDELHRAILECFALERILNPEKRAASDLANEMMFGGNIECLEVTADTLVLKFKAPAYFVGTNYSAVDLGSYGLTLIAVTREVESTNLLQVATLKPEVIDTTKEGMKVQAGDKFTAIGTRKAFKAFLKDVN